MGNLIGIPEHMITLNGNTNGWSYLDLNVQENKNIVILVSFPSFWLKETP